MRPLICTDKSDPERAPRRSRRRRRVGDRATRPEDRRSVRLELRAEQGERSSWIEAAEREGYLSASDWIRDRLNAAARASRHGSSADQTWNTPLEIIRPIVRLFGRVTLDPCSNARSIVAARVAWELERDGDSLIRSWLVALYRGRGLIFVNPPYDDAARWIAKCVEVWRELGPLGVEIVILIPARTDTKWWRAAKRAGAVPAYYEGRIAFLGENGKGTTALFPSALLYFGKRRQLLDRLPRVSL